MKWILSQKLLTGSTIYNSTFFKEMNNNGPFHVFEDSQHDPLYWLQHPEPYLNQKVYVFLLHQLFFLLRLIMTSPYLVHLAIFFWLSMPLCPHPPFLYKFYVLQFSATKNLMTNLCSSMECSHKFVGILNCLKTKYLAKLK